MNRAATGNYFSTGTKSMCSSAKSRMVTSRSFPLSLYFFEGKVKVELALARG